MNDPRPAADNDDLYGDPAGDRPGPAPPAPDPAALFVLLDALRLAAPADLQDRLTALIREALLTLRALIDHYLERLDSPPADRKVEDIPID
ncbi:MAG TPA: hypothetical protein VFQ14_00435 [Thermoleophilaceae bacterium]|nr:hypothetical protein [Thermoleophilaceae bacterium]